LEKGVTLTTDSTNTLTLVGGDTSNPGGKLAGLGTLSLNSGDTKIVGGADGWEAVGGEGIKNSYASTKASIVAANGAASLKAGGPGATITVATAAKELEIGALTTIELGGSPTIAWGVITLKDDKSTGAKLSFNAATSKVLLGAGTGGTAATGDAITIGGITAVNDTLKPADYLVANGFLVQLGGTTASGSITATNTQAEGGEGADVNIASNTAFTGGAEAG
jgi:hypothetical protein